MAKLLFNIKLTLSVSCHNLVCLQQKHKVEYQTQDIYMVFILFFMCVVMRSLTFLLKYLNAHYAKRL